MATGKTRQFVPHRNPRYDVVTPVPIPLPSDRGGRKIPLESDMKSPTTATTNRATPLTVEALASWRCRLFIDTIVTASIPARPVTATGCRARTPHPTRGDITIAFNES